MEKRNEIKNIVQNVEQEKQEMPNDFAVAFHIYETTEIKKELTYFGKLVQEMDLDKLLISRSLDALLDLGLLCGQWKNVDARWVRAYKIHPDALVFVEKVYCNYFNISKEEISKIKENGNIEKLNEGKQNKFNQKSEKEENCLKL